MVKLAHETSSTSPDNNGNCQRVDFDPYSSKYCCFYCTYQGKRFSYSKISDPKHETMCIVRVPSSGRGSKEWADLEIRISETVRNVAADFLKKLDVRFVFLQYANLLSVALFCKKRCEGEHVLCEDKLPNFTPFVDSDGRQIKSSKHQNKTKLTRRRSSSKIKSYDAEASLDRRDSIDSLPPELASSAQVLNIPLTPTCPPLEEDNPPSYDDIYGDKFQADACNNRINCLHTTPISSGPSYFQSSPPPYAEHPQDIVRQKITDSVSHVVDDNYPHPKLRAFIHFYLYQSGGQSIVCNLKGTCEDGERYTLSTPIIHSLKQTYGERDKGLVGMKEVINNHRCSRWCKHLPSMDQIFNQAYLNEISNLRLQ